jgi:TolA-binding protein
MNQAGIQNHICDTGVAIMKIMNKTLLIVLCWSAVLLPGRVLSQEAAAKEYQKAYGYILDEKWTDAKTAFAGFLKNYPKSAWNDAAHYWICYTRDKLGEAKENVFDCYRDFITSYPKSKWMNDAKSAMVNLGYQLAKE